MRIMHACCCGLDVHKKMILACLLRQGSEKQIRQFGTTTGELQTMKEWLVQSGCTHIAIESTGVYWKPVYNILEGQLVTLFRPFLEHLAASNLSPNTDPETCR